jgi:hypothetical protein
MQLHTNDAYLYGIWYMVYGIRTHAYTVYDIRHTHTRLYDIRHTTYGIRLSAG